MLASDIESSGFHLRPLSPKLTVVPFAVAQGCSTKAEHTPVQKGFKVKKRQNWQIKEQKCAKNSKYQLIRKPETPTSFIYESISYKNKVKV